MDEQACPPPPTANEIVPHFFTYLLWILIHGCTPHPPFNSVVAQLAAGIGFGRHPLLYNPTQFALRSSAMSIWGKLDSATAELLRAWFNRGSARRRQRPCGSRERPGSVHRWRDRARCQDGQGRWRVNALKKVFKIPAGEMKNVANIFNLAKQDVIPLRSTACSPRQEPRFPHAHPDHEKHIENTSQPSTRKSCHDQCPFS